MFDSIHLSQIRIAEKVALHIEWMTDNGDLRNSDAWTLQLDQMNDDS